MRTVPYLRSNTNIQDTKAAGPAQVFAPILDLLQQPLWSRTYETFGEDPYLTARMGRAVIEGIQGPDPRFPKVCGALFFGRVVVGCGVCCVVGGG
jgi:beta-glucosidase-like glycosyl hydrolase